MILKELSLKNFISYKEATIRFPRGVIVVVGENGAGKTTILDAVTYALCKKHSREKDENLIRRGFNEAAISLKFSVRGKNYEVRWNLSRGKSAAGYLRNLDEGHPLVRPGTGEKTILPEIRKILGLSEDIFMNATYVKQGEITKLIDLKPSDRKKLIGQLLGIEVLEKIWENLKDPIRDLREEISKHKVEVEKIPEKEEELKEKEDTLSAKQKELEKKISEREKLETTLNFLKRQCEELEINRKKYYEFNETIGKLENKKMEKRSNIQRLGEKIEELWETYNKLREYAPHYEAKIQKEMMLESLLQEKEELQRVLEEKRLKKMKMESIEREKQSLKDRIKIELNEFRRISGIQLDILQPSEVIKKVYEQVMEMITDLDKEIRQNRLSKQKYSMLKSLTAIMCVASSMLLLIYGKNVISLVILVVLILLSASLTWTLSNRQKRIENQVSNLQEKRQRLLFEKERLQVNINQFSKWYNQVKEFERDLEQLERDVENIGVIESQCNALEQKIKDLKEELQVLDPFFNDYVKARGILEKEKLENIQELEVRIEQLKREKYKMDEELRKIDEEIIRIGEEIKKLDYNEEDYQRLRKEYDHVQQNKEKIGREIGELEGTINVLSYRVKELKDELNRLISIKKIHERLESYCASLNTIRELFSKDGYLQKAIRRKAALLIEEYARQLLQEFSLPFFDIRIDEDFNVFVDGRNGEQTLEMLSGGEKVAMGLILRLSIAAALAGEALELLLMDEPTIHLDSERRKELVNILKNFKGGGRMITQLIVVSHDRELEEAADEVYEVEMSESGSKIKQI